MVTLQALALALPFKASKWQGQGLKCQGQGRYFQSLRPGQGQGLTSLTDTEHCSASSAKRIGQQRHKQQHTTQLLGCIVLLYHVVWVKVARCCIYIDFISHQVKLDPSYLCVYSEL